MDTNLIKKEIASHAQKDEDIQLAEKIYSYFLFIEKKDYLPWKKLKSFFVAARSKDSATWGELTDEEARATNSILEWTGYSANTIAVILRIYERATPELKDKLQTGRISRYPAETISRLYKGALKNLQPKVLEMYLKYKITNEKLRDLVEELQRTIDNKEQEQIMENYKPREVNIVVEKLTEDPQPNVPSKEDEFIYLLKEVQLSDLQSFSIEELLDLQKSIEAAIQRAVPTLKRSMELVIREMQKKLTAKAASLN